LPDIESEVSVDTINFIEENKRMVKMMTLRPTSP